MANKNKRSLEDGGKREQANAAKAANARERNIAKHYLNAGPNITNLARAAYHWYNSVPWLGGQNESGLIIIKGDAPTPGMRNPKTIVQSIKAITKANASKITPAQWTAAQDAAIARGDMAEAQRLRDLHFEVSAPNTQIKDIQYHGARGNAKFNIFDPKLIGQTDQGWAGRGYYFTPIKDYAKMYGSEPRAFYINAKKVHDGTASAYFGREDGPAAEVFKRIRKKRGVDVQPILDDLISSDAIRTSFPQIKPYNGTFEEVVTRNNNQMKLADAITYDNKGVRIPLGERDNFNSNDIRYALMPFIIGGTGYGIYNRSKKRNGGSNNINYYKRSLENAGTVADYIDAIYSNNPKEEFLGEPEHHYDFTQSEEWANAHGYYPDKRGHRDDRVKKPTHPSHPSRGTWEGNNFILTNKGLADPNYIFFGLNDGGQDPQAILKYKDTYVLPEFTVTPKGNYINNSYDNIRLHFKEGGIYIKPSKRGTFTDAATKHGMGV